MKMKKTIILLFVLLIPIAFAIYGGEREVIHHFDKCSSLDVIVSGTLPINETEYSFLNCSEIFENEWECNCYDGFDLIITTKVNTLNNYSISMTHYYGGTSTVVVVSHSSGRSDLICGNWSECIDGNKTRLCYEKGNEEVNYTYTRPCNITITKEEPEIKEPDKEIETNKTIIIEPDVNQTIIIEPDEPEQTSYKMLIIAIISIVLIIIITLLIIRHNNEIR